MFSPNLELDLLIEQRQALVANKELLFKEKGQCKETLELSVDILNFDQEIATVMEDCRKADET